MKTNPLYAPNSPARFVGLDIGGSKTRGIVWTDGAVTSDVSVGSTNVQNVSPETAAENMATLFAGLDSVGATEVFAGAGGVDTDDDAAALASLITPFVAGAQVSVVHDTRLLLAAAGATAGVAVIAGTGSAAWGVNQEGEQARAGGGAICSAMRAAAIGLAVKLSATACAGWTPRKPSMS